MKSLSRLSCLVLLACSLNAWPDGASHMLLRGGLVVDGSGAPARPADVLVAGDRIAAVEPAGAITQDGLQTIELDGLVLAPGFIDLHAHLSNLSEYPQAENFLRQGITTSTNSLHSHDQPWPLSEVAQSFHSSINVVYFAGHTWIRKQVLGLADRAPGETELQQMSSLVAESMRQGAFGLASGLEYVPAVYAGTAEVTELARVAAASGGIYMTHMRDEGVRIFEALDEAIAIGRDAGLPVHINHLKLAGSEQFGRAGEVLQRISEARLNGVDITFDVYPYTAFSTYSDILFPAWSLEGGSEAFAERWSRPEERQRILRDMAVIFPQQTGGTAASIQFRSIAQSPEFNGRTLADLLQSRNLQDQDMFALLGELQATGGFIGIFHSMAEADVDLLISDPHAMIESDGDLANLGEGHPHPRAYGAFPRVLARYVRERDVLALEDAIARMTSMPAARLGLSDRGQIRAGYHADLVAFDPATVTDHATYDAPHQYPSGIVHVWVNGEPVIAGGNILEKYPGRMLSGPAGLQP